MATIPSTGVNLATHVRDVLNAAGGSVNNNIASFFTAAAKINPWSKHKPVVLAQDFCQDYDSGAANYNSTWWRGTAQDCGLTVKTLTSFRDVPAAMDGEMNGWSYLLPDGGSRAPFRLGDFRGYDPDAKPMLWNFKVPETVSSQLDSDMVVGTCMLQMSGGNSLTFADFPRFKDCYLGMYLLPDTGTQSRFATSALTLGNNGSSVKIEAKGMPVGNWTAYPFISSVQMDSSTGEKAAVIYTLPMNKAQKFRIISSYVNIMITATLSPVTTSDKYIDVVVKVKSGNQSTFANCYLSVRKGNKGQFDGYEVGEISSYIGFPSTINVTADDKYHEVWSGRITVTAGIWLNSKIWVTMDNGVHVQSAVPLSDTSSMIPE